MIKVKDGGIVTNKAAHLVIGVDTDGFKHVLGIWLQHTEGFGTPTGSFDVIRAVA